MKHLLLPVTAVFLVGIVHAQQYINSTILESLRSLSPILYSAIQSSPSAPPSALLTNQNITFFLPTEAALNNTIAAGKLNFSSNAYDALNFLTLNGSHHTTSFTPSRKFYTTNSMHRISIGPTVLPDYQLQLNSFEIYAGLTKAKIVLQDIQCSNGLIQMVDNFLQPAETPLDTISDLEDLEYMEELLKSLNVSDTISGMNKTILAPTNQAWHTANGSSLPFGTLIHNLKYLVIDGMYTSDQFLTGEPMSFTSDCKNLPVVIQLQQNKLVVNGAGCLVKTDILTTSGIIHLIDIVLSADSALDSTKNTSSTAITTSSNGNMNSNTTTNRTPLNATSMAHHQISLPTACLYFNMLLCLAFFSMFIYTH